MYRPGRFLATAAIADLRTRFGPARRFALVLGVACASALGMPATRAQGPAATPVAIETGTRTSATQDDTIEQRVRACTACHDVEGRRGTDAYYPRIAGKPQGYLFNQLVNFREGRRFYALMTYLVEHLPDPYLREMAAHFAAIDVPYPPPQPSTVSPEVLERGRVLAQSGDAVRKLPACAECHGTALTGVSPAIPGLLGLPRDYLGAQFGAWRSGLRRADAPDCMGEIAKRMSSDDILAVSAWLASQAVHADARPAAALPAYLPIECGNVAGGSR